MELRHPTPDELKPLLEAVDTFVWAWAVKTQSNRRGVVNWKGAIEDLTAAYERFQIVQCPLVPTLSNQPTPPGA